MVSLPVTSHRSSANTCDEACLAIQLVMRHVEDSVRECEHLNGIDWAWRRLKGYDWLQIPELTQDAADVFYLIHVNIEYASLHDGAHQEGLC